MRLFGGQSSDNRRMSLNKTMLKPGDTLGGYQLLLPIGQGGMGRVWAAREAQAGPFPRWVAIKTALAESSSNRQFWTVLLDEAHIASRLRHPNVCAIHAVETEGSVVYLVMDWSDAGSLREVLDAAPEERIAPQLAARVVASVCAGLHAAHELTGDDGALLGVVHRDVSPQNILFSTSGQVKVADFGVAKARGQLQEATRTGEIKGKLSYMAPEQVTLKDFDRRADVFALGCVLYEATLGRRPFHGNDALATLYSLLEQPLTSPREVDPSYPSGLETIVLKALERDPELRYQTAEELGYALESWMNSMRAIVTEAHIASLLRETLGDRIKARAAAIQEMVRKLDAGERISAAAEIDEDSARSRTPLSMSTTSAPPEQVPKPRRGAVFAFAFAIGLAATGAAAAWLARPEPQQPAIAAKQAPATLTPAVVAPATSKPSGREVVITLRASPELARISVDGSSPQSSPLVLRVAADAQAHQVVASAVGYHDKVNSVAFDTSQTLELELEPVSRAARRPNGSRVAVEREPTSPPPKAPAKAPTTQRAPGELPAVVEKAPRSLDADNPFAQAR
jgi:eukaryotic-like serine/threonine-protein kinase